MDYECLRCIDHLGRPRVMYDITYRYYVKWASVNKNRSSHPRIHISSDEMSLIPLHPRIKCFEQPPSLWQKKQQIKSLGDLLSYKSEK